MKCFRQRVETVKILIAAGPESAGSVSEERIQKHTAETSRLAGIVFEDLDSVAVITVQATLGAEPEKPITVLSDLRDSGLGKSDI